MVSKKGKRILKTDHGIFYWYVKNDWYSAGITDKNLYGLTLYIISENRKEAGHYLIGSDFFTITSGEFFSGKKFTGWQRIKCPVWSDKIITPGIAARIINWHMDDKKEIIMTDYRGNILLSK